MLTLNIHIKPPRTCCQGLVEFGFLTLTKFPFDQALIQSGIILFFDQSPPPITFPALEIPIFIFVFFFKNSHNTT